MTVTRHVLILDKYYLVATCNHTSFQKSGLTVDFTSRIAYSLASYSIKFASQTLAHNANIDIQMCVLENDDKCEPAGSIQSKTL